MLQNYLDMLLYDRQTALVTAAVLVLCAAAAFWLQHTGHRRTVLGLLILAAACPAAAAGFWYLEGGFGGGIFAMTLCLFGLPALCGFAAGRFLAVRRQWLQQHRLYAVLLALALLAAGWWARPRPLAELLWGSTHAPQIHSSYVSDIPSLDNSHVLVSEDGGSTWQAFVVRNADEVNAALGSIRCGPKIPRFGGPQNLPQDQLLLRLNGSAGDGVLLLCTKNGPSYLLSPSICTVHFDWHLLIVHHTLQELALTGSGWSSRVLGYPALYHEVTVWLTAAS